MDGDAGVGIGSIPAPAGEPQLLTANPSLPWVYPRACGGTGVGVAHTAQNRGLSPRLRGNRPTVIPRVKPPGSIPAPAGEPRRDTPSRLGLQVYPRACGGTEKGHSKQVGLTGLSPRLRGNQVLVYDILRKCGSIPAPAGEPSRLSGRGWPTTVYPRACGGTSAIKSSCYMSQGLSPRLRGNPWREHRVTLLRRSIPAPAGNR